MSTTETVRGFQYDALTTADDNAIENARENLYACPCGDGTWVSVRNGRIYRGHGGNERAQWELQRDAPWIKLDGAEVLDKLTGSLIRDRDAAAARLQATTNAIRDILEGAEQ